MTALIRKSSCNPHFFHIQSVISRQITETCYSLPGVDAPPVQVTRVLERLDHVALRPQTRGCLLGTGMGGGGGGEERVKARPRIPPKKTGETVDRRQNNGNVKAHTPSIAFRHLRPNSARFSYATEGALFISAQLSTDSVSALPERFGY